MKRSSTSSENFYPILNGPSPEPCELLSNFSRPELVNYKLIENLRSKFRSMDWMKYLMPMLSVVNQEHVTVHYSQRWFYPAGQNVTNLCPNPNFFLRRYLDCEDFEKVPDFFINHQKRIIFIQTCVCKSWLRFWTFSSFKPRSLAAIDFPICKAVWPLPFEKILS